MGKGDGNNGECRRGDGRNWNGGKRKGKYWVSSRHKVRVLKVEGGGCLSALKTYDELALA